MTVEALGMWWARLTTPRDNFNYAAQRRGFAIHAYVGPNGGMKSMCVAHDTVPALRAGRPVLSTMRFLDFADPRPCEGGSRCDRPWEHDGPKGVHPAAHPSYRPLRTWDDLLAFRDGEAVLDEVLGVASSRSSHLMPAAALRFLNKLRHHEVLLRWTAPDWARADVTIREVTSAVTECRGSFSVPAVSDDGTERIWRDRRLAEWSTFPMADFDEWSSGKREKLRPEVHQWFWRPGSLAQTAYDTHDTVLALATADSAGICVTCGGRRRVKPCTCADQVADVARLGPVPDHDAA